MPGAVFTNILLADEINRTPPRIQASLLEAMQEHTVTLEGRSHRLPDPFLVIATQNPYEHEGIFPLPESQLDRFLFKIVLDYCDAESEVEMLRLPHTGVTPEMLGEIKPLLGIVGLDKARIELDSTEVPDEVARFVVAVVRTTRREPGPRARRQLARRDPPDQRRQGASPARRQRRRLDRPRARSRTARAAPPADLPPRHVSRRRTRPTRWPATPRNDGGRASTRPAAARSTQRDSASSSARRRQHAGEMLAELGRRSRVARRLGALGRPSRPHPPPTLLRRSPPRLPSPGAASRPCSSAPRTHSPPSRCRDARAPRRRPWPSPAPAGGT